MPDIKKLLQRNRFFLEILGIVVLCELAVMLLLDYLAPGLSALRMVLLDAFGLTLLVAPLIFWRSQAVHGREARNLSEAVQHSSTAVLLLDTGGRIYWFNNGFTQMSGYTLKETIGLTPAELLDSGQTDSQTLATLRAGVVRRQPCRAIVRNRHKDGSHYYVDIDFRPDYDARGKLVGFIEICTDVTELKRTEQALEASLRETESLRQTVNTHAIVSVADCTGRITDVNPAFCDISGYSREQLLGQDHRILNSGTHSAEFWRAMWDEISNGRPWRGEICNRNQQGQLYWVDSMIAPFKGADGLVEKYVSIRLDVTARKLSELELARQTQLTSEVVDASPYGIAVYDDQQVLRLHNSQFSQILVLPPALLAKSPFHFSDQLRHQHARGDYENDLSLDAVLARFQDVMAARGSLTLERRQFDGRHIELRAYPISAGWTVLSYRDNTERKMQQLQLLETQERVRLATESAGIGIWSLNTISGEQTWDAQQYRLFGVDKEAHSARKIYDLWSEHLHPQDAEAAREAFQYAINNAVPFDHVFRIIRPDGEVRHIKALGSPRLGADGRVEYIFGTNMDITDATLLAESMQKARDRAEEATLAKSQFMTNMSHEMRTPMNAVLGMLKLLGGSELSAPQHNFINHAEQASRMMVHLIDDILENAQLSSGIVLLVPKPFRLQEVLQPLSDLVRASVGTKDIDVRFDLDPHLPTRLYGDRQRLQQVLVNLLGNAIKFTLNGEVVCSIRLQVPGDRGSHLVFCIKDTGIGIAPEFRQHIFQSFTQVHATTTRAFGGVGLGLPISQRLVQLMGGTIQMESEVGVGSSFSFALDLAMPEEASEAQAPESPQASQQVAQQGSPQTVPVADDKRNTSGLTAAKAAPKERPQRLKGLRVLAVDDMPINQTVIEQLLNWEGAQVTLAVNGKLAVEAVLSAPADAGFDVVLMDIQMPVMDGYEATRQLRGMPQFARLPIIAVTANVLESDRALSLAAGMNHHVGKPYDLDELVGVICSVIAAQPGAAEATLALPQAATAPGSEAEPSTQPLHVYWLQGKTPQIFPDAAILLHQGVVLEVLDSVEALAARLEGQAPAGLLVLDQETATGPALAALALASRGASMQAMPMIALAEAATEEQMHACRRAGVVDLVPSQFALDTLDVLGKRYFDDQGQPRTDLQQNIDAIDSQRAMKHMQADAAFFGSLLRAFFDELPARKKQLQDDWLHQPQQIKHHSHALKGLALTLGLRQLAQVAVKAETLAAQGAVLDAGLLAQLEGELQSAGFQILRWLALHQDVVEVTQ